jgi:hypothetical protein
MKHVAIIASLLLAGHLLPTQGAPECILSIDEIPPKGATQVWSPLFQASWEKLNEIQVGKLEKVVPPNDLITKLEEFEWQAEEVMPKDGYAVYAGPATQEFALETAASIKKKFDVGIDPSWMIPTPHGKAAYGILLRELKFKKKFFRSQKKALEFQTRTGETRLVEFFGTSGVHSDAYGDHVKVLHYAADTSSFVLSVATDKEGENLIVYRPDQESCFRDAMELVKKAMGEPLSGHYGSVNNGSLHQKDVVKIPYLTLDVGTDFTEQLSGSLHFTGDSMPWRVKKAFQLTKFELFEEGARVRVDTGISADPFGGPPEPPAITPRSFICDRPFYVFLWRTAAEWPYLAVWIDGGDCLTPFIQ